EAEKIYEKAITLDFENQDAIAGLKCSKFWIERSKQLSAIDSDDFTKSEYLYNEWRNFSEFIKRLKTPFREGVSVIKQWVFQTALTGYLNASSSIGSNDEELLLRIGKCYKGMGDYDKALEYLERTLTIVDWYPEANYHIGLIYERKGLKEKALEFYIKEVNNVAASAKTWQRLFMLKKELAKESEFPPSKNRFSTITITSILIPGLLVATIGVLFLKKLFAG
ncbi:MAG: tetratricopeptide repeat protein, partial [Candidatus Latescibacteria bacterium]|nr:tetratricopeptide repeat protein [Candidatus Latescibacterota bacterium]